MQSQPVRTDPKREWFEPDRRGLTRPAIGSGIALFELSYIPPGCGSRMPEMCHVSPL